MLTEKHKNNIRNLPYEDLIEMHKIIIEVLRPVTPNYFIEKAYNKSRQWLPKELDSGKIESMKIPNSNKRLPYLNVYLDKN